MLQQVHRHGWRFTHRWRDGHISHTVTQVEGRTVVRMGFSSRSGRRTSHMHMHYLVGEPGTGIRQFVDEHVMTLFTTGEYEHALFSAGLTGVGWEGGWVQGRDRLLARRPGVVALAAFGHPEGSWPRRRTGRMRIIRHGAAGRQVVAGPRRRGSRRTGHHRRVAEPEMRGWRS